MSNHLALKLMMAAEGGDAKSVAELLKQGANPNVKNANSYVLHVACFLGHKEVVALLLKYGANTDSKDKQNFYPLHLAATQGHTAVCNLLIKAGANINIATNKGDTAIHIAAAANHAQTVLTFIKGGCDVNVEDRDGNTPISIACSLCSVGVVKSLIKAGANVNIANNKGNSPLLQALWTLHDVRIEEWTHEVKKDKSIDRYEIKKGCFRLITDFKSYKNQLGRILSLRDQRSLINQGLGPKEHLGYLNTIEIVKQLLKAGAKVAIKNDRGLSPLRVACYAGVPEIIKILFKKGAKLDLKPWNGISELHQIAGSGRLDGLEMFFKLANANSINWVDKNGWTAAHFLADTGGPVEMAALLKKHGADTSIKTTKATETFKEGMTPAQVALHWKDMDLAFALDS